MRFSTLMKRNLAVLLVTAFAILIDANTGWATTTPGVAIAATATYTPSTSASDVNGVWRKVQGNLQQGFRFLAEEWEMLEDLEDFDIDWSAREITVPVDLNEGYGVASIPEGGYEARPSTPNVPDLTLTWILMNKRFTATKTARYIDERNRKAMIKRQLLYQGKKAIEAISTRFGDFFYGVSTGVLAQADGAGASASSHTITLKNGYGSSTVTGAEFITKKFKKGDWVALIQGGALVTNAIGEVTDRDTSAGTIDVTWNGAVTITDGDNIVGANSLENSSIAGTDYNRGLVGLLDMILSTSLHSLSGSTYPGWNPSLADTAGGRFSPVRLMKGEDEIEDNGGGKLNCLWLAKGVKRDMFAMQAAALRFNDPFALEIRGKIKGKGLRIKSTQRVPPGYAIGHDKKSVRKMTLLNRPNQRFSWSDGKEMQDQSGFVFSVDFPAQLVNTNRANTAYWSGLTEQ